MLELQRQLRKGKTPQDICEPLGIDFKEQDGKILFSYDMIGSYEHKDDPIVKESRGLILYKDTWDVASMAFSRFFNYGETGADKLPEDLTGCLVLEKLDGTLISLYFDKINNRWEVATRNMPTASGPVNNCDNITFEQLFWEGAATTKLPMLADSGALGKECTYVFELTGPKNRIVTPYKETTITLLTIRNNKTLYECDRDVCRVMADMMECDLVKAIDLKDWKELLSMESRESVFEGYVVVKEQEPSHLRVKVKNPAYLQISKLCHSISESAFMELIKLKRHQEYLEIYPEYEEHIKRLTDGINNAGLIINREWEQLLPLSIKKIRSDFAKEAVKMTFPAQLFQLYDGKEVNLMEIKTPHLLEIIKKTEKIVKF